MSKPCAGERPPEYKLSSTLNQKSHVRLRSASKLRKNVLLESQASASPLEQFSRWFDEAQAAKVPGANAMTLATVDASGPSARIVLIKGYDERGFTFTNYESRKGTDLLAEPRACLLFFWQPLERQVRIEGVVEKVAAEKSDAYATAGPPARIGAWASRQSQPITREELEAREQEFRAAMATSRRATALGRLPPETHRLRILAGPPVAPARPPALRPRRAGWKIERLSP